MYNPNDPQRKLRRPQPLPTPLERAIDRTRTAPVPAAGPLPNAPVLENPSITERAMSQGAIPTMQELPSQIGPAPNVPMRPRTDAYRPPHLDSMEQYDPIAQAREDYLATPKRSFKQTLRTAGLGALQGLATGGIGGAIGGALGGAYLLASDRRVKTDIVRIGKMDNGLPLYSFKYKGKPGYNIGVMAQDVEKVKPDAVIEINGVKHVNYGAL